MFRLDGKVALVTGSNRGLGAAIARAFAGAGASVVLHDIAAPEETARRIGEETKARTHAIAADVGSRPQADRLIEEAVAAMGSLDILVNNAGIIRRAPAVEHSDEYWDSVLEINLTAVFRLCRAAGAHMLRRGRGKIINIASLLSFQGGINVPSYAAAKGGVAQITKSFANEWAGRGVNVNAIAPGYMRTENTRPLFQDEQRQKAILERIPAARWGEPEDLAGAAIFLASSASDYVHGHVLVVDGGWMAR